MTINTNNNHLAEVDEKDLILETARRLNHGYGHGKPPVAFDWGDTLTFACGGYAVVQDISTTSSGYDPSPISYNKKDKNFYCNGTLITNLYKYWSNE